MLFFLQKCIVYLHFEKIINFRSEEERLEKNAWLFEAEEKHNEMIKNMLKLEHEKEKVLAITDGKVRAKFK